MQDDDAVRQKLGRLLVPFCRNGARQGIEGVAETGSRDEASEGGRRNEYLHDLISQILKQSQLKRAEKG